MEHRHPLPRAASTSQESRGEEGTLHMAATATTLCPVLPPLCARPHATSPPLHIWSRAPPTPSPQPHALPARDSGGLLPPTNPCCCRSTSGCVPHPNSTSGPAPPPVPLLRIWPCATSLLLRIWPCATPPTTLCPALHHPSALPPRSTSTCPALKNMQKVSQL